MIEELAEASGLIKQIEKIYFIFLFVFQTKLFDIINVASKLLQSKNILFDELVKLLKQSIDSLIQLIGSFLDVKESAEEITMKCDVHPNFQNNLRK